MNNDKNNENSVKFILEMFFSFSVFFQCSKKFESLIVTEYMCTYQENLGKDGYFDLLQANNLTNMKSI